MSFIESLNKTDFTELVKSTKTFVFLDFYADWCGPCVAMSPIIEGYSQDPDFAGKVLFYKCNVDYAADWAAEFGVSGIPAFFLVETNASEEYQIIKNWIGFKDPDILKADILLSINTKDNNQEKEEEQASLED